MTPIHVLLATNRPLVRDLFMKQAQADPPPFLLSRMPVAALAGPREPRSEDARSTLPPASTDYVARASPPAES